MMELFRGDRAAFFALMLMTAGALFSTQNVSAQYCSETLTDHCTPGGMVSDSWNFSNVPSSGLMSVTFPITVHKSPFAKGWYFAQQFTFLGNNGAYIGIRPDTNGREAAAFSVFGKGTTIVNKSLCRGGADGGSGTSCTAVVPFALDHQYYLTVYRDPATPTVWRGKIQDHTACVKGTPGIAGDPCSEPEIGAWSISAATGIASHQVGFMEYYSRLDRGCAGTPYADVEFFAPTTPSGLTSVVTGPKPYGACKSCVNYSGSADPAQKWVRANVGF